METPPNVQPSGPDKLLLDSLSDREKKFLALILDPYDLRSERMKIAEAKLTQWESTLFLSKAEVKSFIERVDQGRALSRIPQMMESAHKAYTEEGNKHAYDMYLR